MGLAAAVLLAGACIALLASGAAQDKRLLAGQPGAAAPDFTLRDAMDVNGGSVHLADLRGSVVVAYFSSIRCPVSNDYDARIAQLAERYGKNARVKFLAIHSGAAAEPASEVSIQSSVSSLHFPHLLDTDGAIASLYGATQTPTFLVIDRSGDVRYRGAFDDNREVERVTHHYLDDAIIDVLKGRLVRQQTTDVNGCAIR
jgi:peroxiredoxin